MRPDNSTAAYVFACSAKAPVTDASQYIAEIRAAGVYLKAPALLNAALAFENALEEIAALKAELRRAR